MARSLIDQLEAHHSESWGWALACSQWQHSLAEDALQESYLRVLDGRARYAGRSSRKTWFFGVIRRVAAELRRSQARRGPLAADAADGVDDEPALTVVEQDRTTRQLRRALRSMPRRQREVLHLVFYAGLTLDECAQTLGMTVGAARTHYHRGKQRLAVLLELGNA